MRAIVTGAAGGIGRAVTLMAAERFGPAVRLVLADLHEEGLVAVADAARTQGAEVAIVRADVADPAACARIVEGARATLGGLDALISNAGVIEPTSLAGSTAESFDRTLAINTRPTLLLGTAALDMLSESGGAIVATASISAQHATPNLGAYSASKAALVMLVRQMAVEWGPLGVRCNTVSPGPTLTGMTSAAFTAPGPEGAGDDNADHYVTSQQRREAFVPLRRVSLPEDIAQAILFLASPEARQITGVDLLVDGGLSASLMPATGGGSGHIPRQV